MTKLTIQGGKYKGHALISPPSRYTRPTQAIVKSSVFNTCQMWIEGIHFLDICAGSGAMSFEALSRGASHATMIEKNPKACQVIKKNAERLKCTDQVSLHQGDLYSVLPKLNSTFELIFLDPPYAECSPSSIQNIISLMIPLLEEDGYLFIEGPKHLSFTHPDISVDKIKTFGDTLLFVCKF